MYYISYQYTTRNGQAVWNKMYSENLAKWLMAAIRDVGGPITILSVLEVLEEGNKS